MPLTPRVEAAIEFTTDGGPAAVILTYEPSFAINTQQEIQDIADAVNNHFSTIVRGRICADTRYDGVTCRSYGANNGWVAESTVNAGVGVITGDSVPAEVGVVIRKLGNGPAKRAHGRNWWPGCPEVDTNSSRLTDEGAASWLVIAEAVKEVIETDGGAISPVVMSRASSTLYPFATTQVERVLAHQTRRRPLR